MYMHTHTHEYMYFSISDDMIAAAMLTTRMKMNSLLSDCYQAALPAPPTPPRQRSDGLL